MRSGTLAGKALVRSELAARGGDALRLAAIAVVLAACGDGTTARQPAAPTTGVAPAIAPPPSAPPAPASSAAVAPPFTVVAATPRIAITDNKHVYATGRGPIISGERVIFSNDMGEIFDVPKSGGPVRRLVKSPGGGSLALASAGGGLFWTYQLGFKPDTGAERMKVGRLDLGSGFETDVFEAPGCCAGTIVADAQGLVVRDPNDARGLTIMAHDGKQARALRVQESPKRHSALQHGLATDGESIYFIDAKRVLKVPRLGGQPTVLVTESLDVGAMGLSPASLVRAGKPTTP